jgi:hypothetical protein
MAQLIPIHYFIPSLNPQSQALRIKFEVLKGKIKGIKWPKFAPLLLSGSTRLLICWVEHRKVTQDTSHISGLWQGFSEHRAAPRFSQSSRKGECAWLSQGIRTFWIYLDLSLNSSKNENPAWGSACFHCVLLCFDICHAEGKKIKS